MSCCRKLSIYGRRLLLPPNSQEKRRSGLPVDFSRRGLYRLFFLGLSGLAAAFKPDSRRTFSLAAIRASGNTSLRRKFGALPRGGAPRRKICEIFFYICRFSPPKPPLSTSGRGRPIWTLGLRSVYESVLDDARAGLAAQGQALSAADGLSASGGSVHGDDHDGGGDASGRKAESVGHAQRPRRAESLHSRLRIAREDRRRRFRGGRQGQDRPGQRDLPGQGQALGSRSARKL